MKDIGQENIECHRNVVSEVHLDRVDDLEHYKDKEQTRNLYTRQCDSDTT